MVLQESNLLMSLYSVLHALTVQEESNVSLEQIRPALFASMHYILKIQSGNTCQKS